MKTMTLMVVAALAAAWGWSSGALASPLGAALCAMQAQDMRLEQAAMRGGARRGRVQVNRSVGVNRSIKRNRNVNINRKLNVSRIVVRKGVSVRPDWNWSSPIATGEAGGVAFGAAAARLAGRAPARNLCWYFSSQNTRRGFWDRCQ